MPARVPEFLFQLRLRTILLLALAARLVWVCVLQSLLDHHWHRQFLIEGDAQGYWELAHDLAEGRDYSIFTPARNVHRMPGFPALLACSIKLFGDNLFAARFVLCFVGTSACGLVFLLANQIFDRRTASLAGFLAATSPTLIGFTPVVLSETTFSLCLMGSLMACTALLQQFEKSSVNAFRIIWLAFLTGVLISAGVYVRPSWLLWGPVTTVLVLLPVRIQVEQQLPDVRPHSTGGLKLVAAALILVGTVAPLIPWGLRNQQVTGHFVLTTLWMGPSLYDGLNPQASGDSDMRFFDVENLMETHTEYEVNEEYKQRAWAFARENPWRAVELARIKFFRYWNLVPNADQFGNRWVQLIVAAGTLPIFTLALTGIWRSRRQFAVLVLCVGPILYFCALHLLFVSSLRYRLPAEYPLLILSAFGGRSLFSSRT